jgi:hypothetical protein
MLPIQKPAIACALLAVVAISGCGSSNGASGSQPVAATTTAATQSTSGNPGSGGSSAGALSADAHSAATGDIPDNQVFLVFRSKAAGFAIRYPEGWTQSASGRSLTFRDKNNLVRVVVANAPAPTTASVSAALTAFKRSDPTLSFSAPRVVKLGPGTAVKVVYATLSAPNPVTGKRVKLIVDRYELARGRRVATVDLATPKGVDNIDAYRMMIESFRWQ